MTQHCFRDDCGTWARTEQEVVQLIRDRMELFGVNQKQQAAHMGILAPYLCDILAGKRAPGKKVIAYLHLQKQTYYVPGEGGTTP